MNYLSVCSGIEAAKGHMRDLARDKPCMVRLPGICNGNPETTVLAHYRLAGTCGTGMKPPDECACPACFECHQAIDRRAHLDLDYEFVRLAHAEGVIRWIAWRANHAA